MRPYALSIIVCALSCLFTNVKGQLNIDSIQRVIESDTASPKSTVRAYKQIVMSKAFTDSIGAMGYTDRAIRYCDKVGYIAGRLEATSWLGIVLTTHGKYEQARDTLEWLAKTAKENDLIRIEAKAHNSLGRLYSYQGRDDLAYRCFEQYSQLCLEMNDSSWYAHSLSNLSHIHAAKGDLPKSLSTLLKSLDIYKQLNNESGVVNTQLNIGLIYISLNSYDEALAYFEKTDQTHLDDEDAMAVKANLGKIYLETGKTTEALSVLEECLELSKRANHFPYINNTQVLLAECYYELGRYNESFDLFETVSGKKKETDLHQRALLGKAKSAMKLNNYELAEEALLYVVNNRDGQIRDKIFVESLYFLSELYEKFGDDEKAFSFFKQYSEAEDSLNYEKRNATISRIEAEAAFRHERDSLEVMQKAQELAYVAEIDSRDSKLRLIIGGIVVVLALSLVVLLINQSNRKKNRQLTSYNNEIRGKNREIHEKNLELNANNDHLEKLNKNKTRFFSIISHDLRGPIANLIGLNDLIKTDIEERYAEGMDPEFSNMSDKLQKSATHVLNLLDTLMKWALKEEGSIPYKPEILRVDECLRENHEVFRLQAASKNISLNYSAEENTGIRADKNGFLTILRNLTSNALKFTPRGGSVKISATRSGEDILISIQDSGIGIQPENVKRLFLIDEHKVNTGTEGEKGTGLGLNLVHDFVRINKGEIHVESTPNQGTTFELRFKNQNSRQH